eukprot:gene9755-6842_t
MSKTSKDFLMDPLIHNKGASLSSVIPLALLRYFKIEFPHHHPPPPVYSGCNRTCLNCIFSLPLLAVWLKPSEKEKEKTNPSEASSPLEVWVGACFTTEQLFH